MAKVSYSGINVRAATMTGGILGFLCWAGGAVVYAYSGLGASFFHNPTVVSVVVGIVLGAIGGAALSIIYNWTLKL